MTADSIIAAMQQLPVEIYPVTAVREIDRTAIEDEGIPGYTLMCRAGEAAVRAAKRRFPDARRWQVVCGAGNNAGDGYVVARLAAEDGIAVSVISMVEPDKLSGDAATAYGDFAASGGVVDAWSGKLAADAELVVDALLGSGLERPVEGAFADAVNAVNAQSSPVVALDIPTGIHADSGDVLGCAVSADLTMTFVGLKAGLFLGAGREHAGALEFASLEIPTRCYTPTAAILRRVDDALLRRCLRERNRDAHKGDFGHVLVVGGGAGMPGAVRLCGEAALRAGAGLVSIATYPEHAAIIVATRPELMSHAIQSAADLEPLLERADVVAFGPGLGRSEWAQSLYELVASCGLPAVWDADALNLLADARDSNARRIITPHPGEAGRLLGSDAGSVQSDRPAALSALLQRYGGTVVLKGAGTLVSSDDGPPLITTSGNPGMASPGMGDALTGVIAALLAQGLATGDAAAVGAEAHARAGDIAAGRAERGLVASDLIAELRGVLNP